MVNVMGLIKIPAVLRQKLGEEGADALVDVLDKVLEQSNTRLAAKEDITLLRGDMSYLATKAEVEGVKADLIKWSFIFWASQVGIMISLFLWLVGKLP